MNENNNIQNRQIEGQGHSFQPLFCQKHVILVQKSKFKCKIVIIIKVKRSKVKVIELPYLTFPVIVLNN